MTDGPVTAPAAEDPVVRTASAAVGGPLGGLAHGRRRWFSAVGLLLLLTSLTFAIGMVSKQTCYNATWTNGESRYTHFCYSDLPYLYVDRGLAEHEWPYSSDPDVRARYPQVMEYPVGISYYAWATSYVTDWLTDTPGEDERHLVETSSFWGQPGMLHEIRVFIIVNVIGFAVAALLSAWFLARTHRRRPWDAAAFALAPVLAATGIINWDMLAVVFVAGALWAWSRDRPLLTGILIGLGCATKLYPLFLLGGLVVICIRRRRYYDLAVAALATVLAWVLANLPAIFTGQEEWKVFWTFNSERGPDLGSLWLVVQQASDAAISAQTVNLVSWAFFIAWCSGVLIIGLTARETPRLAQLGFLIVAGFLLVNKVYSPQYVLWLLPLAVLAVPRWRDQLIWQAGELFYFVAVWWYLADILASSGGDQPVYWFAILARVAAEIYLIVVVVRDIYEPWRDPVRWTEATMETDGPQESRMISSNEVAV